MAMAPSTRMKKQLSDSSFLNALIATTMVNWIAMKDGMRVGGLTVLKIAGTAGRISLIAAKIVGIVGKIAGIDAKMCATTVKVAGIAGKTCATAGRIFGTAEKIVATAERTFGTAGKTAGTVKRMCVSLKEIDGNTESMPTVREGAQGAATAAKRRR
jgi:hypothetical protein